MTAPLRRLAGLLAMASMLLSLWIAAPAAAADAPTTPAAERDRVLKGDAECTQCHNEGDPFPVLAIGKTRHGTTADARTPTCTSCHGESRAHIDKPKGTRERPKTDVSFGKGSATAPEKQNGACLTCHKGGKLIYWAGSSHQDNEIACTGCHQVHAQHDKVRDRSGQVDTCVACHPEQRVQIRRPSRHPTLEGKVICSDCHNPHGSPTPGLLVRDSVNETCYTCHMEKRGPFVWNHEPASENCSICHNPHGTTNENLLKARAAFLCQQCHEPTGHRGEVPALTGANRIHAQARACSNCHTNVHGSNNPGAASGSRLYQR